MRKATEHSNLFVGNLPQEATEEELSEVFGAYGTVAACRVFRKGRTCALVKMESKEEADRIVEAFEGKAWQARKMPRPRSHSSKTMQNTEKNEGFRWNPMAFPFKSRCFLTSRAGF